MKQFKYVVTLLLLVAVVSTTSFAAAAKGVAVKQKTVSKVAASEMDDIIKRDVIQSRTVEKRQMTPLSVQPQFQAHPPTPDALSGDKHVGVAQAFPYNSLSNALVALQINGVGAGGVRFLLDDAAYVETGLGLGTVGGSSSTRPITIQPAAGVTSTITLTSSAVNGGGLAFVGTSYLTIEGTADAGTPGSRDLTIQFDPLQPFPSSGLASVIRIRDGASNITVQDCNIWGMYKGDLTDARPCISVTAGSVPNSNIHINNNRMTRASMAVAVVGGVDYETGLRITNNQIGAAFSPGFGGQLDYIQRIAVYNEWTDGNIVAGNEIRGVKCNIATATISGTSDARRTAGLYELWCANSTISKNRVDDITNTVAGAGSGSTARRIYGIRVQNFTPGEGAPFPATNDSIMNNAISGIYGVGAISGGDIGLEIFPGQGDYIWYNSISLTGAGLTAGRGATCMQLSGNGADAGDFDVRNNASTNTRTVNSPAGIYRVFNNSGANDIIVAGGNVLHTTGVTSVLGDGNNLAQWQVNFGFDLTSVDNDPAFAADLHLPAGLSSAEGLGDPTVPVADDHDGDARSVTTPDAGWDEAASTPFDKDVAPVAVHGIPLTGLPFGAVSPTLTVKVKNNTQFSVAAFSAKMTIYDETSTPVAGGGTFATGGAVAAFAADTITGYASFTPTTNGPYTIVVITTLAGDLNTINDTIVVNAPIVPKIAISTDYNTCFDNPGGGISNDDYGWTGTDDFVLDNAFTELGGPYNGYSWKTNPGGTYSEGGVGSQVLSPFFDMSGMPVGDIYISFFHSLKTEPKWDFANFQYSTDGGATWTILGVQDDPNGVNWYSTPVYGNTESGTNGASCLDNTTYAGIYGNVNGGDIPVPMWSSPGDCNGADVPTGAFGWIFNQIKLPAGISHSSFIRFRYASWSDALGPDDGWAFDCFHVGPTGATFTGDNISGNVFEDLNGDGVDNIAAPAAGLNIGDKKTVNDASLPGVVVRLLYFGGLYASDTTDGSGNYSFGTSQVNLPGSYTVQVVTSKAITQPDNGSYTGTHDISSNADGTSWTAQDFGLYDGYVSGAKLNDVNDDGINNDGGGGFGGFTIEVHKDSCGGTLVSSGVTTGAGGAFSIPVGPGSYFVNEVNAPGFRQTYPDPNCLPVTVSGSSGSGTAHQTGLNFGNFKLNLLRVQLTIDKNGDGVKTGTDIDPVPDALEVYEFSKNGVAISLDTLGFGLSEVIHDGSDTGTYVSKKVVGTPAGYVRTAGSDSMVIVVSTSGLTQDYVRMDYKYSTVSGVKYEDVNGNGVKDGGEPALSGWKIDLTGTGGGSVVTDTLGAFSFTGVGPGSHTLSEVIQAGWAPTAPAGGTTTFSNNSGANKVQNFGNFLKMCVSGTKYRDANNNGVKDPGETGLAGWTINYGNLSTVTDASGNFSFCDLGAGTDTLSEVGQLGYTQTQPAGGYYVVARTSGTNATGYDFGNFKVGDSSAFRTWTVAELSAAGELKPNKKPKAGKPILAAPNSANLLVDLLKIKAQTLKVGLAAQLNAGGKEKAYLQPKGQSDAYATWNKKGVVHTGPARGFDMDVKGKLMLKRWKSMPATKKNDVLAAELLALRLSLLASQNLNSPAGLGDLIINRPGNPWNGQTITQFADAADGYMTNWEGQPFSVYDSMNTLAALINGAFSTGSTTDTATDGGGGGWFASKMRWRATKYVVDVPFLKTGTATPRPPVGTEQPVALPTVFALGQNYPNPFNPTTSISFDLPDPAVVTLKVYNMLGQEVATLLNNEAFDAGTEEVEFDASGLSSGVYLYRITASTVDDDGNVIANNAFTTVKKMMLVK